jgi:hypothetical protein
MYTKNDLTTEQIELIRQVSLFRNMPDDFKNSTLKMIDLNSQKPVNVKVENGGFTVGSGKFEVNAI